MSSSKARFFNPAVVGLIMLSFFLGTSEYTVIGILPEIADGFGISLTQAGSYCISVCFRLWPGHSVSGCLCGKIQPFPYYHAWNFTVCTLQPDLCHCYQLHGISGIPYSYGCRFRYCGFHLHDLCGRCCFHPGAYPGCDRRCFFGLQYRFGHRCAYRFHHHSCFWMACGFYHDLCGDSGSAGASVYETATSEPSESRKYPGTV